MNIPRITRRLTEFANSPSLTAEEAGELKGIITALDEGDMQPFDPTFKTDTTVRTGINISDPAGNPQRAAELAKTYAEALAEQDEQIVSNGRMALAVAATIATGALSGGATGPAVAGAVLSALKGLQSTGAIK
jgi:hypothetical protein